MSIATLWVSGLNTSWLINKKSYATSRARRLIYCRCPLHALVLGVTQVVIRFSLANTGRVIEFGRRRSLGSLLRKLRLMKDGSCTREESNSSYC